MRRLVAPVVACVLLAGCSSGEPPAPGGATSPGATGSATAERIPTGTTAPATPTGSTGSTAPTGSTGSTGPIAPTGSTGTDPGKTLPDPDEAISRQAPPLAREIEDTWTRLRAEIASWIGEGDPGTWPPPEAVELLALYEQRIARVLAPHQRLAERVADRLPHRIAVDVRANARAGAALYSHSSPIRGPITLRVRRPDPAAELLRHFRRAESRFGVAWEVLAAVMLIETRMGRVVSRSSAGAQGPMQFIPSTWEAYGMGGDVYEERDAILGAANYLRASGAPKAYRAALYQYNPLRSYVTAVSQYAKVMMRDPDAYYAYYNWQVFVRTTRGDVRLSGPGL